MLFCLKGNNHQDPCNGCDVFSDCIAKNEKPEVALAASDLATAKSILYNKFIDMGCSHMEAFTFTYSPDYEWGTGTGNPHIENSHLVESDVWVSAYAEEGHFNIHRFQRPIGRKMLRLKLSLTRKGVTFTLFRLTPENDAILKTMETPDDY